MCNPCLRNELSPISREGQPLNIKGLATSVPSIEYTSQQPVTIWSQLMRACAHGVQREEKREVASSSTKSWSFSLNTNFLSETGARWAMPGCFTEAWNRLIARMQGQSRSWSNLAVMLTIKNISLISGKSWRFDVGHDDRSGTLNSVGERRCKIRAGSRSRISNNEISGRSPRKRNHIRGRISPRDEYFELTRSAKPDAGPAGYGPAGPHDDRARRCDSIREGRGLLPDSAACNCDAPGRGVHGTWLRRLSERTPKFGLPFSGGPSSGRILRQFRSHPISSDDRKPI